MSVLSLLGVWYGSVFQCSKEILPSWQTAVLITFSFEFAVYKHGFGLLWMTRAVFCSIKNMSRKQRMELIHQ